MTNHELESTTGGVWPLFFAGVAVAATAYFTKGIIENWGDFKSGVVQGYNTF